MSRGHIVECVGINDHPKHFWICHRPECTLSPELCGIAEDGRLERLAALDLHRQRGGKTRARIGKRSLKGKYL